MGRPAAEFAFLAEHPEIVESLRERLLSAMKAADPQPLLAVEEAEAQEAAA